MERKTILWIIAVAVVAFGLSFLFAPKAHREPRTDLPWQIEVTNDGNSRVFDLTLNHSTIADAIQKLGRSPEVGLFVSPEKVMNIEVYFDTVDLGGLRAKFVLSVSLPPEQLQGMFDRSPRVEAIGDKRKKVALSTDDLNTVYMTPIATITYLPATDLDEALILKRFGEPTQKIRETGHDVVHWLYPDKGLDIGVSPTEKEVFQYIAPVDFDILKVPLVQSGTALD